MKFAALALVAFASTAAALPATFQEQCCGDFLPYNDGSYAVGTWDYDTEAPGYTELTWRDYKFDNVIGYSNPLCNQGPGNLIAERCVTSEDLCKFWSYGAEDGSVENGIVKPGSNGLLCCPKYAPDGVTERFDCGEEGEAQPEDNPWTCSTKIGWISPRGPGVMDKTGPDSSAYGFYCGRTDACKGEGVVCGDPHFQTWSGDWYDFHGECDMKFLEIPEFGQGLGLEVQIRAKARYEYSYIEAAAIRIGDDVLEVSSYGEYMFNGVENADLTNAKFMDTFEIEHEVRDAQHHIFTIYTGVDLAGHSEGIQIKTFKDLVAVKMQDAFARTFATSKGMMGDYAHGTMLARDGKTVIEDPIEFGMEWQIKSDENTLFQTPSPVEGKCIMPSASASAERRRLGETVPLEAAVAACEAVDAIHHENCVYDVMATGDLEIAHAGVF